MARSLHTISNVNGPSTKSSSLVQYQYSLYLCTTHETTVISRTELTEPTIADEAVEVLVPPGNVLVKTLLFPLFVLYHLFRTRTEIDLYVTDFSGEAILPLLIASVTSIDWVIFSTDSPDGKKTRRDRSEQGWSLRGVYDDLQYVISLAGFRRANLVLLSDETDLIPDERKSVVAGGVDCEKVAAVRDRMDDTTTDTSPTDSPPRIVYVGNMYVHRGVDILFRAIERCESTFELILIGPRPSVGGPETKTEFETVLGGSFDEVISGFDVDCRYLGVLDHEAALKEMLNADIGVCILPYERDLPMYYTSYPIKVFEYMATDLAVLGTRTRAMEDLLTDPQLLDSHDITAVADRIDTLVTDRELRSTCTERNRQHVSGYCWDELWEEIDEEILSVLGK